MNKKEELRKLNNKAREKGWLRNNEGHTNYPINQYLSKKDYERWCQLALKERVEE